MERELFIVYTSELFRAKHPYEITEKDPEVMMSFHQELEKKYEDEKRRNNTRNTTGINAILGRGNADEFVTKE